MNQTLEIGLRCFVNPQLDNWAELLPIFAHSYNTSIHTATKQSPAFLLRGFQPLTPALLLTGTQNPIQRLTNESDKAIEFSESMKAIRKQAQDALVIAQSYQQKAYNKGRTYIQFQPGDLVVINPHSLELLKDIGGKGRKLQMKYDGPFEVMDQISPVSYRLRFPDSYKLHPVINVAHLEPYESSPKELGERPIKHLNRHDFKNEQVFEVEKIVEEKLQKKGLRRIKYYRVRWKDYGPEWDSWLTAQRLRNAPKVMAQWNIKKLEDVKIPQQ
ncbi:Integrase core domain containing protein [Ceratobasidium theobromae]|uniref:Integrase core domain containing protein n=1 Tax=Ceratobasidium theobromae TaxID=1582974 RepID=A0A5N5Q7C0_9AGAM|nr:Integrase core domain containing protein [Ceratobasidium theobromae]